MRSVKSLIAAGAASLLSTAAFAADMAIAPPPPMYAPPPAQEFGGWYLRGDIGFSNQKVSDLHYGRESAYSQLTSFNQESSFDSAGIFGAGLIVFEIDRHAASLFPAHHCVNPLAHP